MEIAEVKPVTQEEVVVESVMAEQAPAQGTKREHEESEAAPIVEVQAEATEGDAVSKEEVQVEAAAEGAPRGCAAPETPARGNHPALAHRSM